MPTCHKENELINCLTFDDFARKFGVVFSESGIKVPAGLQHELFVLFTMHYAETLNAQRNAKWLTQTMIDEVEKSTSIEQCKHVAECFKKLLDNIA